MDASRQDQEIDRLRQTARVKIIENPANASFVCVHSSEDLRDGLHRFPFLLPLSQKEEFLAYRSWDKRNDNFRPVVQCEESFAGGTPQRKVYYLQRGNESGAEALVRTRYYWRNYPAEIEIAEEFRLFWNLLHVHDKSRNIFLHCDDEGAEHEVVRIHGSHVEVQLRFLTEYLRAKQTHLALQFEGYYWSKLSLAGLGLAPGHCENNGELFHWWLTISDVNPAEGYYAASVLTGKVIIPCPGEVQYHPPGHDDDMTQPAFIVGQDAAGQPVLDTWDEARKGHSTALTPVFFSRSVLGKYFAEPERYEVDDGDLRCPGFWSLRMDNDHPGHLVAWLKDLAQGLPRAEREHWRSKNILPDGVPSKTFYIRNVRALPANPVMPDLRLKMMYPVVNEAWAAKYGWQLWREPQPEDRYVFRQLHVCLDENQSEFDQQNGLLAKVIVDFVNKERLTAALMEPTPSEGGLNVLQAFLEQDGHTDAKEQVEPLRVIQQLRSAGAAHGKGANYAAAMRRGELVGLSLVGASMKVFQGAVAFITWIGAMVLKMPAPEPWPID